MKFDKISAFGKKFVVEPSGTVLTDAEKRSLEELQPAGIMFRKRNFLQDVDYPTWLAAYSNLLKQCREAIGRNQLIVSIDHEGGRVIRPPLPITPFPYAAKWSDQVVPVASAMAIELKSLGINVNFAPVADIHSNPDNPVINERSFGTSARAVAEAACGFATVMSKNQIIPCAKHFPGHGDTKQDSHYGLPILDSTKEELGKRELIPFQSLIDIGVPMVMTAHLLFPKIDPENQATISRKILHDLLREEMGFKGAIIADALGMKAISAQEYETTIKAVNASLDLFLVAGDNVDLESALRIARHMQQGAACGDVKEKALTDSFNRIEALLEKLPQHPVKELNANVFEDHARLADELSRRKAWSTFDLRVPGFE
jgi:beta-N-acetylhexosaminidase